MPFQTCCFGKLLQFVFGQCPLHAGFGEVVGRFSGQQGQYPPYILVIHHAYDDV